MTTRYAGFHPTSAIFYSCLPLLNQALKIVKFARRDAATNNSWECSSFALYIRLCGHNGPLGISSLLHIILSPGWSALNFLHTRNLPPGAPLSVWPHRYMRPIYVTQVLSNPTMTMGIFWWRRLSLLNRSDSGGSLIGKQTEPMTSGRIRTGLAFGKWSEE